MSSSDRINENGHLSPRNPSEIPPYEILRELVDFVLEGDTESALQAGAHLSPDELKFYHEKMETLRQILAARRVVNMLKSVPDVAAMMRDLGLKIEGLAQKLPEKQVSGE